MKVTPVGFRGWLFALTAITIFNALPNALAQQDPNARYYWDRRPARCFSGTGGEAHECKLENWPSFNVTVQRVAQLYLSERFHLLETALAEIASSGKRFPSGYTATSAAYSAFRELMNGRRYDPGDRERIARWKEAVPESYYAVFAEARLLYAQAWSIRGSGFAGSVSKESWELFAIRLLESEQVLLKAPQQLKNTPLWHQLLLAIVLDTDRTQTNAQAAFEAAVGAWPGYFQFYEVILTRMTPRWGGNWEAVDTFIDGWSKRRSETEGDSLYARLYLSLITNDGATPDQMRYDWPRMRKSLDDLLTRYPDLRFRNQQASFACVARDKEAFGAAMRKLAAKDIQKGSWIRGHSYDACMRWAGT